MSKKSAGKSKVKRKDPAPQPPGIRGPLYRGAKDTPLLRAMVRAGLSARELAARLGCSEWSVGRWLGGDRPIPHYRACLRALLGADAMPEVEASK
jgi:hypothetical protein